MAPKYWASFWFTRTSILTSYEGIDLKQKYIIVKNCSIPVIEISNFC